MSLIVTSNTQDTYADYDHRGYEIQGTKLGIENPADYHNHLTSPLDVKKNSQIAVQSVKFTRTATSDIEGENLLCYFGRELGTTLSLNEVNSRPELILIGKGNYNRDEFARQLEKELNFSCNPPAVKGNFRVNTSLINNDFGGYKISASQNGPNFTDKFGILTTSIPDIPLDEAGVFDKSDKFTFSGQKFTITEAGSLADGKSVGIITDTPFATNCCGAECVFDFANASTGAKSASWIVGLTRPTLLTNGETINPEHQGIAPEDFFPSEITRHFWDYAVKYDPDTDLLSVFQSVYESVDVLGVPGPPIPASFRPKEVIYWGGTNQLSAQLTGADLYGAGLKYTRISFEAMGDEIAVWIGDGPIASGTYKQLVDSRLGGAAVNASRVFKPVSQWTCALYPKIQMGGDIGRSIDIEKFDSFYATSGEYKYPTLTGQDPTTFKNGTYTVGDDPYSNIVSRLPMVLDGGHEVENQRPCWAYRDGTIIEPCDKAKLQMVPKDASVVDARSFQGVNASSGTNYEQLLVLEPTGPLPEEEPDAKGDYYSGMCHISRLLGFPDVVVLDESYGVVTNFNLVTWTSTDVPDFSVHSAFVRLVNTTQRSYNACKNSVSKILYHIPRFTNDGRQYGELFWEVSERVYVDFGNTDQFVLNQFQVQIVDKNERIVRDLEGETIVVFHVRDKASAGKFE
tara:strand:+ start:2813 stop:4864 length:2052 start_codon:yes stop_codon:yes gene_type:complete